MSWVALVLHAMLLAAAAPLLAGALGRVGGAPPLQPWRDLVRLWRKAPVRPAGTSPVFAAAPAVSVAAAGGAALLVPSFTLGMATASLADLVVIAGLLAVSRAAPALAAYDAGAVLAQAGMRDVASRLGAVPVLLLVALELVLLSGGTNVDAAAVAVRDGGTGAHLSGALGGVALLGVAVGERAAADTAFSGRARALIVLAGQLRLVVALTLSAAFLLPIGLAAWGTFGAWSLGLAWWVAKLGVLAALARLGGRAWLPAAALLALAAIAVTGVQGAA